MTNAFSINKLSVLLHLLIGIFLFSSCSKNQTFDKEFQPDGGKELLSKISAFQAAEDVRISFSTLNPSEKSDFWLEKLKSDKEHGGYTLEQIAIIDKLISYIEPAIFDRESDKRAIFKVSWFPQWINESKKELTEVQIYNIAFSIGNNQGTNTSMLETSSAGSEAPPPLCICAVGSHYTCYYGTISGAIGFAPCKKTSANCITKVTGCGALFDDDCDGNYCDTVNGGG